VPDKFGIKDCFIVAFPIGPASCRKAKVIDILSARQPFPNPLFILLTISRGIVCSKALPNQSPDAFGHRVLKKEMVDCFQSLLEKATLVPAY